MKFLLKRGYIAEVIEKFIPFPKPGHRKDTFGCDIFAIAPAAPPILVQSTTESNMSSRRKKMRDIDALRWFCLYGRVELHGWFQRPGTSIWCVRVDEFTMVNDEYQFVQVLGAEHLA